MPIWGLTVQNEPMATQTWESCLFTGEEERDFVRDHLGPALEQAGLARLKLMIWDHNRGILFQRAKAVYDDPAAARYVWGAAFHWYVGDHFDNVRLVHDAWPDKQLLFTEGTPPTTTRDGDRLEVGRGLRDVDPPRRQNWATGWTDWNVLLDEQGGPNHVGNFCFAPVHGDTQHRRAHLHERLLLHRPRLEVRAAGRGRDRRDLERRRPPRERLRAPRRRLVAVILNKTDNDKDVPLWVDGRAAKAKSPAHSILTLEAQRR